MELLFAILFVCNVQLTECQVLKNPMPFNDRAKCNAALQAMGAKIQAQLPIGKSYTIVGACGPRLGVDEEPS